MYVARTLVVCRLIAIMLFMTVLAPKNGYQTALWAFVYIYMYGYGILRFPVGVGVVSWLCTNNNLKKQEPGGTLHTTTYLA